MRKKIDRFAGCVLCIGAVFMLFSWATGDILKAMALSIGALLAGRALIRRARWSAGAAVANRRLRARAARGLVDRLSVLSENDALSVLKTHLHSAYPETTEADVVFVLGVAGDPPIALREAIALLHNTSGQVVLATTGTFAPGVRENMPKSIDDRCVLLDRERLNSVFVKSAAPIELEPPRRKRRRQFRPNRKKAVAALGYALLMLVVYGLLGNIVYLLVAMCVMLAALLALRREHVPETLF